ncbi:MAG: quinate/shikimate dehydrogenase, partial [Clostridiaceae bacterium]|nr:quinate/shikimate dehydrogenase [Clostridiaceae bacterium]
VVYDIIYNPPVTRFMKMSAEKGCNTYNGLDMLIYQGLIADEMWFGKKLINDEIVQKIKKKIGENG